MTVLRVALTLLSISLLASWLFIAVVHADDRYSVGWVEGSRMALARSAGSGTLYPPLYDGAVLWGVGASAVVVVRPDLQAAVGSVFDEQSSTTDDQAELARVVGPNEALLAEDPYVPVSLGRTPVVLDAWALLRLGRSHPQWVADLAGRIEDQAFDKIVLVYPITFEAWYRELHFGQVVSDAIRGNYRLAGRRAGYYVYVPGEPDDEPGSGSP